MNTIAESHRTRIGCSQLGQALGVSRWGSAYDLWEIHTGRREPEDLGGALRVALGEPMESVLRPFVAERLGRELRRDRREYLHPTLPLIGHVDYRAGKLDGEPTRPVVDMKTSLGFGARHRFGTDDTDEVDDDVMLQMHGYMLLTGASTAFVAALVPGPQLKVFPLARDEELIDLIVDGVERFRARVQSDTPPDPQSEAEARQRWLAHRPGKVLDVDAETAQALRDYAALKAREREIERELKAVRDRLIPALADADTVAFGGATLATYRANKSAIKTDWERVAAAYAAYLDAEDARRIAAEYTRSVPGPRVLKLSKELSV